MTRQRRSAGQPLITFTSDFGCADSFVGVVKGVILSRCPSATVVDLTHGVRRGDVAGGAFVLARAIRYFPPSTLHLAVVDPGVGSGRKAVVIRTRRGLFLGPDNGLFSFVLREDPPVEIYEIRNRSLFLRPVSRTFHGRDVFAPVTAALANGLPLRQLGPRLEDYQKLSWPQPEEAGGGLCGEVVYIDIFGNAITNLPNEGIQASHSGWQVRIGRKALPVSDYYAAVPPGRGVVVPGSSGYLEIAINQGDAAESLALRLGTRVRLVRAGHPS